MLENQLLLIVCFKYERVFIEAFDASGELHSAHQVNCEEYLVFSGVVEERFLNVLRKLIHFSALFVFAALISWIFWSAACFKCCGEVAKNVGQLTEVLASG